MYIFVTLFSICYAPLLYIYRHYKFHAIRAIADCIVVFANVLILIFLIQKLSKFQSYELKQSVCSIYIQFFLFLFSYLVIVVTDFIFGWFRADFMDIFFWHEFIIILNEVLPLVPITYVLYVHRQTFKHDNMQKSSFHQAQATNSRRMHRES